MNPAMAGRSVFLYSTVDTFDIARGPARMAVDICAASGASLGAMVLNLESSLEPSFDGRSEEELRADFAAREETNAGHVRSLEQQAAKHGIVASIATTIAHSHGLPANVADRARLHDLSVIGTNPRGMMSEVVIAEHLLFESGRPVLVVPPEQVAPCPPRKVAVAWDNSRPAARALGDALPFLMAADETILITISDEKDIANSMTMEDTLATLMRKGLNIRHESRPLGGMSIGQALQGAARDLGVDMLVMGGYGHSRLRQFLLGGATREMLRNPDLPILIAH